MKCIDEQSKLPELLRKDPSMTALDEQGRPIIHSNDTPNARNDRERWVMVKGSGGPDTLIQEYVTTGAHALGSSHVRRGMTLSADDFGTADLPHEVRHNLYKFLEEQNARSPKPHGT